MTLENLCLANERLATEVAFLRSQLDAVRQVLVDRGLDEGAHAGLLPQRVERAIAGLVGERDAATTRSAQFEQGLRDIEERLRLRTGPLREALQGLKDPAVVEAWKWAVYGSCIHAQLVLRRSATPGEGGGA